MTTPNIHNKSTPQITHHQIITGPHQWNVNTLPTHNRRNNTTRGHLHNHAKLQIYVNYVKIKAIMTINASSPAILWPEHKRHLIKADHITIKSRVKGIGQMGRTTMKTQMANLFSSGGSRCC